MAAVAVAQSTREFRDVRGQRMIADRCGGERRVDTRRPGQNTDSFAARLALTGA